MPAMRTLIEIRKELEQGVLDAIDALVDAGQMELSMADAMAVSVLEKDLSEYDEMQLLNEISRRQAERAKGRCEYCGRSFRSEPCKFPERHARPGLAEPAYLRAVVNGTV